MSSPARDQFLGLLRAAVAGGTLVKLTLAKPAGGDPTLENLFVRPVTLQSGPRLAFVWRHRTRDITKNHPAGEALALLEPLVGAPFQDAHLFTAGETAQLEAAAGAARLRVRASLRERPPAGGNDRSKQRVIPPDAPWLRALGVTDRSGRPLAPMTDKFRQIEHFAEIVRHLLLEAPFPADGPIRGFDMGCGKGYLTFAVSDLLGERSRVRGIEQRPELVEFCARTAAELGFGPRLGFEVGSIDATQVAGADLLIALHACDTATDDALAKGIAAGAALILAAPCCQKELRPQLQPPSVLAGALRHGIFQERQAEFVTDALRAQLLEWAGYRTRVFEFISTEHTAKNTMISAIRARPRGTAADGEPIREFAAFYGIREQALARRLGFALR